MRTPGLNGRGTSPIVWMNEVWSPPDYPQPSVKEYWFSAPTGTWWDGYRPQGWCRVYDAWRNGGCVNPIVS